MKKLFFTMLILLSCFSFAVAQNETEKVGFTSFNISGSCSMYVVGWKGKVFNDGKSLKDAMPKEIKNCEREQISDIDFEKHTLIGVGTNVGNCPSGQRVLLTIEKDSTKKVYIVKMAVGYNPCRGLSYTARWALVPKIPSDYKIEFNEIQLDREE